MTGDADFWFHWRRLGLNLQRVHCGRQASMRDGTPIPVCKCQQQPMTNRGWILAPKTGKMVRAPPWVREVIDT